MSAQRVLVVALALSLAVAACGRQVPAAPSAPEHGALSGAAIAYDPATGSVVAFGGAPYVLLAGREAWPSLPDAATFAWNGSRWLRLSPPRSPEARSNAALAYDRRSRRLILYGGEVAPPPIVKAEGQATEVKGVPAVWRTDTWSWDGRTWTQVADGGPVIQAIGEFVDPTTGSLLLFGAKPEAAPGVTTRSGSYYTGVWSWSGGGWSARLVATPVQGTSLALDPASGRIIGFRGQLPLNGDVSGGAPDVPGLAVTTAWTGTGWQRLSPGASPPEVPAVIATVPGGVLLLNERGQTWRWNGSTWSQLHPRRSPPGIPPNSALTTMVADPAHGEVLLIRSGPTANDQSWVWNGATWTEAAFTP